jgi:hypothetical protein
MAVGRLRSRLRLEAAREEQEEALEAYEAGVEIGQSENIVEALDLYFTSKYRAFSTALYYKCIWARYIL